MATPCSLSVSSFAFARPTVQFMPIKILPGQVQQHKNVRGDESFACLCDALSFCLLHNLKARVGVWVCASGVDCGWKIHRGTPWLSISMWALTPQYLHKRAFVQSTTFGRTLRAPTWRVRGLWVKATLGNPLMADSTIYALSNHLKYAKSFRNQTKANVWEPISSNIQRGLSHLHNFHGYSTFAIYWSNGAMTGW